MNKKITTSLLLIYIIIELFSFFNYSFFSIFNKVNVLFTFAVFITVYISNFEKINRKECISMIIISILLFISMIINNGTIGSVLNIICLMIGIQIFSKIEVCRPYKKLILLILFLLLGYCIVKSSNIYMKTIYFKNTDFNSNTIAQCILYINMIILILINKKKMYPIIFTFLVGISIYGIINTQSRGALISYIIFIVLHIFKRINFINKKIKYVIMILTILGVFFPILYLNLYKNNVDFKLPFMEKSLYTGRENLWLYSYENLTKNTESLFIGLGSNFEIIGQEDLNLHNLFFALVINFGVINFVLILIWLICYVKNNINRNELYTLLPIVVLSYFETTILWNAIIIFILLIENSISNRENEKRKDE